MLDAEMPSIDDVPDAFTFVDVTDAAISTHSASNTITVSGLGSGVSSPISITGGEYLINGGAHTSAPGTVVNGDEVAIHITTSASYSTAVSATLTIGGVSDTYTVTTAAEGVSGLTAPGITLTSDAGDAPEWDIELQADHFAGYFLYIDRSLDGIKDGDGVYVTSEAGYPISYYLDARHFGGTPDPILKSDLAVEGYADPAPGDWYQQIWVENDGGEVSPRVEISGTLTASTAVLATTTGTAKHTSYDTLTYNGLGGRMTANVGGNRGARATVAVTGKRHWEVTIEQLSAVSGNKFVMGMCDLAADMSGSILPGSSGALGAGIRGADNSNNITQLRNGSVASTTNMGSPIAVGDVYVMEFDTAVPSVTFWRHRSGVNTLIYGPTTLTSQIPTNWVPTVQGFNTNDRVSVNFGAGAWAKTPTALYEGW
jgi:hypothetical protein